MTSPETAGGVVAPGWKELFRAKAKFGNQSAPADSFVVDEGLERIGFDHHRIKTLIGKLLGNLLVGQCLFNGIVERRHHDGIGASRRENAEPTEDRLEFVKARGSNCGHVRENLRGLG